MATEIAVLMARVTANVSDFERGMSKAKSSLTTFEKGMGDLQNVAGKAMTAVGVTVGALGGIIAKTGIEFNAMKEQADIAFTTMLGSGEAAQGMLNNLQDFAASTPFEFPDLIRASQRMMAMGFTSKEVIPTLTAVGDAVAALGGERGH